MNTVARIIFYLLFILGGLLFIVMGFLGAGVGFGHGGPNNNAHIGLFLMGGIAALVTGIYAMFRGLGTEVVLPNGTISTRFASVDAVILIVLWVACLGIGAFVLH